MSRDTAEHMKWPVDGRERRGREGGREREGGRGEGGRGREGEEGEREGGREGEEKEREGGSRGWREGEEEGEKVLISNTEWPQSLLPGKYSMLAAVSDPLSHSKFRF